MLALQLQAGCSIFFAVLKVTIIIVVVIIVSVVIG